MGKMDVLKNKMVQKKPEILTGVGCIGVITTAGLAIEATPHAMDAMEYIKKEKDKKKQIKMFVTDVVPCYLPTIISGAASIACIIGSHQELKKRNLVTAGLYAASEKTLKTYQEKVIEKIGEKKEKEIRDDIAQDKINKNPMHEGNVIITGRDAHWVYDSYSGRYFRCDMETIRRAENNINAKVFQELYATLNDFYFDLPNVEPLPHGDNVGWSGDTGMLQIYFSARLNENGEPCIVMDYHVNPIWDN